LLYAAVQERSHCSERYRFRGETGMAKKARKQTSRGRKQDRARVAGAQDYEVRYEAKKTGWSKRAVKKVVQKVGTRRKEIERGLARRS
jgi:hypothetical protein